MYCYHCGTYQEESALHKISFRAECIQCGASLHSCVNCRYYKEGMPNDCEIAEVENVRNKEAMNFCEFFQSSQNIGGVKKNAGKERFDDLFK